jgi:hypothetical protein
VGALVVKAVALGVPLRGERQQQPRFDEGHMDSDGKRLRFGDDGNAEFDDDHGCGRSLLLATPR